APRYRLTEAGRRRQPAPIGAIMETRAAGMRNARRCGQQRRAFEPKNRSFLTRSILPNAKRERQAIGPVRGMRQAGARRRSVSHGRSWNETRPFVVGTALVGALGNS